MLLRGPPVETIARACKEWGITRLCWEADTEPYAVNRDRDVRAAAEAAGIAVESPVGHTLYDSAALIKVAGGKAPSSMKVFCVSKTLLQLTQVMSHSWLNSKHIFPTVS